MVRPSPAYIRMLAQRDLRVRVERRTTADDWPNLVVVPIDDDARARSQLGIARQRRPSHAACALLDRLLVRLPGRAMDA